VRLLQPLGDLVGVLVLGVAARRLGRVAPPLEVLADGPHRHLDPELLTDQVAHRLAAPHRGGDAQLLGAVVVDLILDAAGLLVRERPAGAHGAAGPVTGEGLQAVIGIGGPPSRDGLAGDPEHLGYLGLGVAQLTTAEGAQAEGLKDLIRQLPCIWQRDGHDFLPFAPTTQMATIQLQWLVSNFHAMVISVQEVRCMNGYARASRNTRAPIPPAPRPRGIPIRLAPASWGVNLDVLVPAEDAGHQLLFSSPSFGCHGHVRRTLYDFRPGEPGCHPA